MAEDFGDDAARQLYDWLLHAGSLAAQRSRSSSFEEALRNIAGRLKEPEATKKTQKAASKTAQSTNTQQGGPKHIRLDMHELKEIEDYEHLKDLIDTGLRRRNIPHSFVHCENESYLDFYLSDAPKVSAYLNQLIEGTRQAHERLQPINNRQQHSSTLDASNNEDEHPKNLFFSKNQTSRDTEPLRARTMRAREASQTIEANALRDRNTYKEKSTKRKERSK